MGKSLLAERVEVLLLLVKVEEVVVEEVVEEAI